MQETIIETRNLSKSYGDIHALQGLDLLVPAHSVVGFLGPNGAGKSTTIKLLLGLIRPTSGSGSVFGLDIEQDSTAIRQRIGYLSQKPRFYPNLTARETLAFVARFFMTDERLIRESIGEALSLVNLEDKADRPIRGFSGGEMQRLGIAQAQINKPDLLILDEPAAALDPMGRDQVLNIMDSLRHQSTIFYSTHILDDVQRVSDRVVILDQGKLVAQGPIDVLLAGEEGTIYKVVLSGNLDAVTPLVKKQDYVKSLSNSHQNGNTRWQVAVSDEERAKDELLRLILSDESVTVLSFERQTYELEDVFMQLVGGRNSD